ncbi:MAG: AMP-binding protein, partial [Gemmatimonadaceae bacterium]
MTMPLVQPIWRPSPEQVRDANITQFVASLRARGRFATGEAGPYGVLHEWSIRNREEFWRAIADFCGLIAQDFEASKCSDLDRMAPPDAALGPKWFDGAKLNFAENLLRYRDDRPAIISWNEMGRQQQLTFAELGGEVSRIATALRDMGVGVGDRVAGFLPNLPETIIAMLAATTLGAVWSSCSPDFGVQGVLDRFGQIEPKVLVCADGYRYAGKEIDCLARVREIASRIPSIANIILVPYLDPHVDAASVPRAVRWDSLRRIGDSPAFVQLAFDHPVYVMYSSGTTGLPKCMVHGAGGTLLQHLKELVLHTNLTRDDRMFYYTTCGWMMWNWMLSSLAVGATVVLYDGAALQPRSKILWDLIERERVTVFGTSAKYLALAEKTGLAPRTSHNVACVRTILSTGSPLADHSYDYVYRDIGSDIHLASISG